MLLRVKARCAFWLVGVMSSGLCLVTPSAAQEVGEPLAEPVAVPSPLPNPDDDERARTHFAAGESYFEQQRFEAAAREFREAFELSGRPEMLIDQARALALSGHVDLAIEALELLLDRYPQTSYRGDAEVRLANLRRQLEMERVPSAPSEPTLAVDLSPTEPTR